MKTKSKRRRIVYQDGTGSEVPYQVDVYPPRSRRGKHASRLLNFMGFATLASGAVMAVFANPARVDLASAHNLGISLMVSSIAWYFLAWRVNRR